jgi:hypothetical protein
MGFCPRTSALDTQDAAVAASPTSLTSKDFATYTVLGLYAAGLRFVVDEFTEEDAVQMYCQYHPLADPRQAASHRFATVLNRPVNPPKSPASRGLSVCGLLSIRRRAAARANTRPR